jgi:hypothetical protein
MRTSSLKSAIAAATVAAIFAVAPLQLGSSHPLGFPQAMAASHGGASGGHVGGSHARGFAGTNNTVGQHQDIAQGAGNPSNAANSGLYNSRQ